jgi:hypothetical protein
VVTSDVMPATKVERPVVIGVLGTHSTGKSTFVARLAHELRLQNFQIATVADLGEQAQRMGLPILYNHTWASTLWIITRGISNELEAWLRADVVLVDRAVPDALGYYHAALEYRHEQPSRTELGYLEGLVRGHCTRYDLLFRTVLDTGIPLGGAKNRDNDSHFRSLADHHIARVLDDLNVFAQPLPADGNDHALQQAVRYVSDRLTD